MMRIQSLLLMFISLCLAGIVQAETTVNALFCDHAVLQHGIDIPVWGTANNGENITVEISDQKVSTVAKDGKWSVRLRPLQVGGPYTMTITGGNIITISDILVGEVWICSGQSNMERHLGLAFGQKPIVGWEDAVKTADMPNFRQFHVKNNISFEPIDECEGNWVKCSPETAEDFTAVGFFFGRDLHQKLNVPVGIIFTAWGGTIAEAWTSADGLKPMADFADAVKVVDTMANSADPTADFENLFQSWLVKYDAGSNPNAPWYLPTTDTSSWPTMNLPQQWENSALPNYDGMVWFSKTIDLPEDWSGKEGVVNLGPIDDIDCTWVNGVKVGSFDAWYVDRSYQIPTEVLKAGKNTVTVRVLDTGGNGGILGTPDKMSINCPTAATPIISLAGEWKYNASVNTNEKPSAPQKPGNNPNIVTVLYNAMLHPLQPYAIRGAIWYQGESNNSRARQYRELFPLMIKDWRNKWEQGNFPFLFTQIAPHWEMTPELREAQLMTLTRSPNTAMAVTTDVGDAQDIHPADKGPVGKRLALAALALAYNENIEYSGPLYSDMSTDGNKITLSFTHIGSGLMAKDGPLKGFIISGKDKNFKPANAEIKDNTVVVWSDEVTEPVAVRYGWTNVPDVNLFNKEGLPASPFRTDID